MRIGELSVVALTALLLVLVVWWPARTAGRLRATQTLVAVTAVVLLAHTFLEFPRFLLLPAVAVFAVLAAVSWRRAARPGVRRGGGRRWARILRRLAASLGGLVPVAVSGVATWALPVFAVPAPTGPYAVGAHSVLFLDNGRVESRVTDAKVARSVPATIWYPAESADGRPAVGYDPQVVGALTTELGVPGLVFDYLPRINTHTFAELPPAAGKFPVLLYSPGFGSTRNENMAVVSDLVSHGYVVVGMDHPGTSAVVSVQNGEEVLADWQTAFGPREEIAELSTQQIAERAQDVVLVLDSLAETTLGDHLDLETVGIFGFSYGGATAAQVLYSDPRVRAAVNLDGSYWGPVAQQGVSKPLLHFRFDPDSLPSRYAKIAESEQQVIDRVRQLSGPNYQVAMVENAMHLNYNDTLAIAPIVGDGLSPARSADLLRRHIRDYFDHHLRGEQLQLVGQTLPEFPEILWED
ncbi:alpha/beta hydrolase family protein [Buchananella hordeovulneris]|uniref:alpha/beta hydrolase family protein n=1 Tax=Buchananella hordeovulneris TaxID=52770 RepID=UPI001C9E2887|nr:hypothetical protein [Buchananella hordeovulneris]